MLVDVNVIVGWVWMSKKSDVRRCSSRPASPVSTDAMSTVASRVEAVGSSAITMVPPNVANLPRTLETIMWRTLKFTVVWDVSMFQTPAGTAVAMLMGDSPVGMGAGNWL